MASKSERERQKQIQDKCQAILGQLLREEDNKYCVDCDAKGPRWASWNLGMFLCIRCAGIHRNLGVHISRVKSVNLDAWTPEQVACLQQMGNSKGRAVYEANLPDNFRRPQTDSSLEAFIRSKYEQKKYIAKEWVQPPMPPPAFDIEEDRKKDKDKKRPKAKGSASDLPAPASTKTALPRPHCSSGQVTPTATPAPCAVSQNTADLLGLDVSPTPGDVPAAAEDPFDDFLSASPVPVQPKSLGAVADTTASKTEEEAFFKQTTPVETPRNVLTKESILSLYSNCNNSTGFGAQVPGTVQMQQHSYPIQGGPYAAAQSYFPGMQPLPLRLAQQQQILQQQQQQQQQQQPQSQPHQQPHQQQPGGFAVGLEAQQFCSNPFLTNSFGTNGPANLHLSQMQQQMAGLQLGPGVQGWAASTGRSVGPYAAQAPASWGLAGTPTLQGHTLSTNLWQ